MSDYHSFGVNVKVYDLPTVDGQDILSDDTLTSIYYYCIERFWDELSAITKERFGVNVYSEGRMGGYAVYDTGDYEPPSDWVNLVKDLVKEYAYGVYPDEVKFLIDEERIEYVKAFVDKDNNFHYLTDDTYISYVSYDRLSTMSKEDQISEQIELGAIGKIFTGAELRNICNVANSIRRRP
jgi:hypothetical protein